MKCLNDHTNAFVQIMCLVLFIINIFIHWFLKKLTTEVVLTLPPDIEQIEADGIQNKYQLIQQEQMVTVNRLQRIQICDNEICCVINLYHVVYVFSCIFADIFFIYFFHDVFCN
eukprot:413607_1